MVGGDAEVASCCRCECIPPCESSADPALPWAWAVDLCSELAGFDSKSPQMAELSGAGMATSFSGSEICFAVGKSPSSSAVFWSETSGISKGT